MVCTISFSAHLQAGLRFGSDASCSLRIRQGWPSSDYYEKLAVPNDHDLIFPDSKGQWQDRRNWQRRGFDVACEKAGLMIEQKTKYGETVRKDGMVVMVPKFRPYDLRHFFASYHIDQKTNLKKLQKMMGHSDIETTLNVYGHLLDDDENISKSVLGNLM